MDRRKLICKALEYIENNIQNRLILEKLAEQSGYSTVQFARLFTEFCGITPMRYVNILRILNAAQLISTGSNSITEIAFKCGFESLDVFERSFKKYFRISPTEYRKTDGRLAPNPFYLSEQIYYERLRKSMLIDSGNKFDWGKTAELYSKSRNIYPEEFWRSLHSLGIGNESQKILDIGTGTGILPINMLRYSGDYTGVDLSSEMIAQAMSLDINQNIQFICADAHDLPFESESFDVVTALQCWVYFDKDILIPELKRVLKKNGHLYIMFMTWLPDEDEIIRKSFTLVHKYNPTWSGYMKRTERIDFEWARKDFTVQTVIRKDYRLPFTREGWCNRMIASRGIGATLSDEKIADFSAELTKMLENETTESFAVLHEAVIIKLAKEN